MADTNPKQLILKSFMHEPNDSTNSDQNLETDKKHDVLYVDVDQTTTLKASNPSKDLIFRSNYQSESQKQKVTG
jgi:chromosome segregation ATPase